MAAAYKASTEQLITKRIIRNSTTFMTGNVRDNCYTHIRLVPAHPHLVSADFIRLLPVATSTDPHIRLLPIAVIYYLIMCTKCENQKLVEICKNAKQ